MRIGLKLTAAFLSIASLVGIVGYLAHATTREVERQMDRLSRSAIVKVAGTTEITTALYASQLAAHAYLQAARMPSGEIRPDRHGLLRLHQNRVEDGLARQNQVAESIIRWAEDQGLDDLAKRERTETLATLRRLREEFAAHEEIETEFLALADQDPIRGEVFLENRLCEHFESRLLPLLTAYRERAEQELTQAVRATERAIVVSEQRRGLLIVFAAVGAVLMGLFISRTIGRPLAELQRAALEIGLGNFEVRVAPRSRDEVGMLALSVNQMAASLQETTVSRSYLDNIIRSMREMLIVTDPEMRIRRVNPAACRELGYLEADLVGTPFRGFFDEEALSDDASLSEILVPGIECVLRTQSGSSIPVHCSAARMDDGEGKPTGYVCVASNISRQKETEASLLASLKEKELLLKEVHHRVKNNLQVISSLLSLQARELADPELTQLFQESQGRVRSMALIHEQLYRSSDLAKIDFSAYVQDLATHLQRGLGSEASQVRFQLDIQPWPLSLDQAIPCGMIVNELVSNAQKHAFPDGQPGEIRVAFDRKGDGYCLTVADNGVGLENGLVEDENSSLGLKVVQALVRQIRGQLDIHRDDGTVFRIRFDPAKKEMS